MFSYLKNILLSKKPFYYYTIDFEKNFLDKLSSKYDIKDDLTRSYCQYKCFKKIDNPLKHWLVYCLALLSNPLYVFLLVLRGFFVSKTEKTKENIALDLTPFNGRFLNDDLKKEFNIKTPIKTGKTLTINDLKLIVKITLKFPLAFYFHQKIINAIAQASYQLKTNTCIAVINNREFWFDSSILTHYYESHNITHINVMHGDKLLWFRDSFFRFHRTYVWDEHYVNILTTLYADKKQFLIAPSSELEEIKSYENHPHTLNKYTYYLQGNEPVEVLKNIDKALNKLGKNFILRPHPRYTQNEHELNNEGLCIENTNVVSIIDSIKNSEAIISQYSTVLFQGHLMGKRIILDDLTNPSLHKKLKERQFLLCSKEHELLSTLIKFQN